MAAMTEPSGFAVAHGWYLAGVYTGLSKIEVMWQCYQSPNFVSVFVWRNSVGVDSQFWWGIEFLANKLAGFDSRTVTIVKLLVKSLCAHMCTLISPILLCTYVHIKPKLILFNIVAPPASYANINSLSTKPMFKTFHLEPIQVVLCIKLGLWVHWWGLLHLPNYCAHMCTIIFHRGLI